MRLLADKVATVSVKQPNCKFTRPPTFCKAQLELYFMHNFMNGLCSILKVEKHMQMKHILKASMTVLLSCAIASAAVAEIVLVVHPSNDASLDAKTAQRIFLGKTTKFSNGQDTKPINQVANSATRNTFDSDVLGRSTAQVSAHWSKLTFTGKGIPPNEVDNDAAVVALVASTPDAVGYVNKSAVNDSVKAITLN